MAHSVLDRSLVRLPISGKSFSSVNQPSFKERWSHSDFIHVSSDCNLPLRKSLRDVEMDELSSLLSSLSNISLLLSVSDRRSCALSSGGSFSIFFSFNGLSILSGHILLPHKQVWNDWTPLKVQGLV